MKMTIKSSNRFLKLAHDITYELAVAEMCKEIDLQIAPETKADKRRNARRVKEMYSLVPRKHRHKLPTLMRSYARTQWKVKIDPPQDPLTQKRTRQIISDAF